ncbi:hypothetical protein [Erysipelothrix anatis]|nr:hypothetical protein [Erysipelothrix anatis]
MNNNKNGNSSVQERGLGNQTSNRPMPPASGSVGSKTSIGGTKPPEK